MAFVDHHARAGGGKADQERAVRDTLAILGARHVLFVDVVDGKVPGDPGKKVDVGLAHRLGESDAVAGLDVELAHRRFAPLLDRAHVARPDSIGGLAGLWRAPSNHRRGTAVGDLAGAPAKPPARKAPSPQGPKPARPQVRCNPRTAASTEVILAALHALI